MTLDTRTRITKAQRFFARLASFDLECPHCGDVYQIRYGQAKKLSGKGRYRATRHPNWDPWTARFTCTNKDCGRSYVLGILAWPVKSGAHHVASAPPADQVPNARQLAQMRKEGGGWWMEEGEGQRYARPHETNLTTEEDRSEHDEDEDD